MTIQQNHCGVCDPRTRMIEDEDGRPYRCPRCHPLVKPVPGAVPAAPGSGPDGADRGTQAADASADAWWRSCVEKAIRTLAKSGQQFTVADVRELGISEPHHVNQWGAAMRAAGEKGLIMPVRSESSTDESRRGGRGLVWVGVTPVQERIVTPEERAQALIDTARKAVLALVEVDPSDIAAGSGADFAVSRIVAELMVWRADVRDAQQEVAA